MSADSGDRVSRLGRVAALLRPQALRERERFHAHLLERHDRLITRVDALTSEVRSLASPPDLERCTYQFRVGPERESMEAIRSTLTADQQPLWAGKAASY